MSNDHFENYRFPSTQEAAAAAEQLLQLGCPREGMQLMRLELVIDRRRTKNIRDFAAIIRRQHGEQVDKVDVRPPPMEHFQYFFESLDAAQTVLVSLRHVCQCRDEGALHITTDGGVGLDPAHFFFDAPTRLCGGSSGRQGHKAEWITMKKVLEAASAMNKDQYDEWRQKRAEAAKRFADIRNEAASELAKTNKEMPLDRLKMFKFSSAEEVTNMTEKLIRLGVPGKAIQAEVKGVLLVRKNDCENIWPQVESMIEAGQGRRVRGSDVFGEWLDRRETSKAELLFADEAQLAIIVEKLKEAGAAEGSYVVDGKKLSVNSEHSEKLARLVHDIRSAKGALVTKLGTYKLG